MKTRPLQSRAQARSFASQTEALLRGHDKLPDPRVEAVGDDLFVYAGAPGRRAPLARLSYVERNEFLLCLLRRDGLWEPRAFPSNLGTAVADLVRALESDPAARASANGALTPARSASDTQPIPRASLSMAG